MLASFRAGLDALPVRRSPLSSFLFALPLLCLPLLLTSCVSPQIISKITITGGKVVPFTFGSKGAEPGRANGYEVKTAVYLPSEDGQEIRYQFSFSAPAGAALTRVQVSDVTEEAAAVPLVNDAAPKLEAGIWKGTSEPQRAGDEHLAWVYTITTSMRIYHFVLTDTAGKTTEIYHVTAYPDFVKSLTRKKWGANY